MQRMIKKFDAIKAFNVLCKGAFLVFKPQVLGSDKITCFDSVVGLPRSFTFSARSPLDEKAQQALSFAPLSSCDK